MLKGGFLNQYITIKVTRFRVETWNTRHLHSNALSFCATPCVKFASI